MVGQLIKIEGFLHYIKNFLVKKENNFNCSLKNASILYSLKQSFKYAINRNKCFDF